MQSSTCIYTFSTTLLFTLVIPVKCCEAIIIIIFVIWCDNNNVISRRRSQDRAVLVGKEKIYVISNSMPSKWSSTEQWSYHHHYHPHHMMHSFVCDMNNIVLTCTHDNYDDSDRWRKRMLDDYRWMMILTQLFIHPLIDWLIYRRAYSPWPPSFLPSVYSYLHRSSYSYIYIQIHSSMHSCIYPSIHLFIHSSIHPCINLFDKGERKTGWSLCSGRVGW